MKILTNINKILLFLELIAIMFLLFQSLFALTIAANIFDIALMVVSILSLGSLINITLKSILDNVEKLNIRYVYAAHAGFLMTIMGVLVWLIDGNGFKSHSQGIPYSIAVGLVASVPYFHVMIMNGFFRK